MRIGTVEDVHELLMRNDDVNKIFDDSKSYLEKIQEKPNDLLYTFELFQVYGLSNEKISEFIKEHLTDALVESIVEDEPAEWGKFNIFPKDYARNYLDERIEEFLLCYSLKSLPQTITPETFLESYSFKEILSICKFDDFYENYKDSGGNMVLFCQKYLSEVGYKGNPDNMLLLIVEQPEIFDFEEFIRHLDVRSMSGIRLNMYVTTLRKVGARDDVICRFYRYAW